MSVNSERVSIYYKKVKCYIKKGDKAVKVRYTAEQQMRK